MIVVPVHCLRCEGSACLIASELIHCHDVAYMPRLASLSVGVCVCMWDGETAWLAVWDDVRKFHVNILFPCSRSVVFLVSGVAWLLRGVVVAAGVRPGVSARSGLRVDLGLAVCALAGLHLGFFLFGAGAWCSAGAPCCRARPRGVLINPRYL